MLRFLALNLEVTVQFNAHILQIFSPFLPATKCWWTWKENLPENPSPPPSYTDWHRWHLAQRAAPRWQLPLPPSSMRWAHRIHCRVEIRVLKKCCRLRLFKHLWCVHHVLKQFLWGGNQDINVLMEMPVDLLNTVWYKHTWAGPFCWWWSSCSQKASSASRPVVTRHALSLKEFWYQTQDSWIWIKDYPKITQYIKNKK